MLESLEISPGDRYAQYTVVSGLHMQCLMLDA